MRLLTLNLWNEQGPWRRRLAVLLEAAEAWAPDLICLQEVRGEGAVEQLPMLEEGLEGHGLGPWHGTFAAAQRWGGSAEGLAILSRYPLEERRVARLPSRASNQRLCLACRVSVEGRPVWLATTHLAYRLGDGALREAQVEAAEAFIQRCRRPGQTTVFAGDFNATPESDEIRFLVGLHSVMGRRAFWQDAWRRCHGDQPGPTWVADNPYTEQLAWFPRDRRLDYVFVSPETREGHGAISSCRIVGDDPAADGVLISDHWGLLVDIAV